MFSVQPRFRFYGAPWHYLTAVRGLLTGSVRRERDVVAAERLIASDLGVADFVLTQQCRFAMYLALKNLGVAGKKVILSPYTIYDVVNMIIAAGGKPVFCDIDPVTCNIDLDKAADLIDGETAGILITHLHGLMADADGFRNLCDRHGIWLMEDVAQAYGVARNGKQGGTVGHVGVFSFGRAKNINGFYGGGLTAQDPELLAAVRRDLEACKPMEISRLYKRIVSCLINDLATARGLFQFFTFPILRYAALKDVNRINKILNTEDNPIRRDQVPEHYFRRITGVQARAIAAQIPRARRLSSARTASALRYAEQLADWPQIGLPPVSDRGDHIYMYFPIRVKDRNKLTKYLMQSGVDVAVQHYHNTADVACFSDFYRDCPVCREVSQQVVLLPTYPSYTKASVDRTAETIRRYFREGNS